MSRGKAQLSYSNFSSCWAVKHCRSIYPNEYSHIITYNGRILYKQVAVLNKLLIIKKLSTFKLKKTPLVNFCFILRWAAYTSFFSWEGGVDDGSVAYNAGNTAGFSNVAQEQFNVRGPF